MSKGSIMSGGSSFSLLRKQIIWKQNEGDFLREIAWKQYKMRDYLGK